MPEMGKRLGNYIRITFIVSDLRRTPSQDDIGWGIIIGFHSQIGGVLNLEGTQLSLSLEFVAKALILDAYIGARLDQKILTLSKHYDDECVE